MTTVVGGVYEERCVEPHWDDVYGSGGRAAAALSAAVPGVRLVTYRAAPLADGHRSLEIAYGVTLEGPSVPESISFDYIHSLAVPRISPRPDAVRRYDDLTVDDDVVLRFGMLEGSARVRAKRAVYDPQSAFDPRPFSENGSSADHLAFILNQYEAQRFSGESDIDRAIDTMLSRGDAEVVVVKMGARGAFVATSERRDWVPPYMSERIFKIGSGDVFSAAFTEHWGVGGLDPVSAADLASRAVSRYVATKALPSPSARELAEGDFMSAREPRGRIYLASPFFNLGERWMIEEIRAYLLGMGVEVFSPLHEVGPGPAHVVAPADLIGLDQCDAVLAILNGSDAGTVFEVGYAVAKGKPVVALAQNMRPEDLKMPEGSGCVIVDDLVSAIYRAVWALP